MMRDARRQGLQFLRRFDHTHLLHQFLQRLNRHVFNFVWEIRLKFQLRHGKYRRPKPAKCLIPRIGIADLESPEVWQIHRGIMPNNTRQAKPVSWKAGVKRVVRNLPPFAMSWVKAVRVNKPKTGGVRRRCYERQKKENTMK